MLPAPSPSTIAITIVRASGQLNTARTGMPEPAAEPEGHVDHEVLVGTRVVVDGQMAERVRVEPGTVPGIEPVGHDVAGFADRPAR